MKTALAVAAAVLFGALLAGAPNAAADAPPPANPTTVRAPIATRAPITEQQYPTYRPRPEAADPATDVANPEPCTEDCAPVDPPEEPDTDQPDTDQPDSEQPEADQHSSGQPVGEPTAPPSPNAKPVDQPRSVPAAIPTPSRIDTGEGPGDPANWWLVGLPALALLGLAAGGGYLWIRRGDRTAR